MRQELRDSLRLRGILEKTDPQVRINRWAPNVSEGVYSIPDSRVGTIAIDVTLTAKTKTTPQIRRFFDSDFRPVAVVIIRPRQLGPNSAYIIKR